MQYTLAYDKNSQTWSTTVHVEVLQGSGGSALPLKQQCQVVDGPGPGWSGKGKLNISKPRLINGNRAVEFDAKLSNVSLDELKQANWQIALNVTVFAELPREMLPGVPVPVSMPTYSGICTLRVETPQVEIQARHENISSGAYAGQVYLYAKINAPGATPKDLQDALQTLHFKSVTAGYETSPEEAAGEWKRVRIFWNPGLDPSAQPNPTTKITARFLDQDLLLPYTVTLSGLTGQLTLTVSKPGLQLDGSDSLLATATFNPAAPSAANPQMMAQILSSLTLSADTSWVVVPPSPTSVSQSSKTWTLHGKDARSVQPGAALPSTAVLTACGSIGASVLQDSKSINLQTGPSSLVELRLSKDKLTLDGKDSLQAHAVLLNPGAAPPGQTPSTMLKGLNIQLDPGSSSWVTKSGQQPSPSGVYWEITGVDATSMTGQTPPASATVALNGVIGAQPISPQQKIITLETGAKDLELSAFVSGKEKATVNWATPSVEKAGWSIPNIVYFLHRPGEETPVKVECSAPTSQVDPPGALILGNAFRNPNYVAEIPVQVDPSFQPENLTDRVVKVTLSVTEIGGEGRTFTDSVEYEFKLSPELVAYGSESSGFYCAKRLYRDDPENRFEMEELEFVADGQDELTIAAGYRFNHWPNPPEPGDNRFSDQGKVASYNLKGNDADQFICTAENAGDGMMLIRIKAKAPLLYKEKRANPILTLSLEGEPEDKTLDVGKNRIELALKPDFLLLKLWIVPGRERGTSIAGVTTPLIVQRDQTLIAPTPDYELELAVDCSGAGPSLTVDSEIDEFLTSERGLIRDRIRTPDWLRAWKLRYSGLNWSSLNNAMFTVKCRIDNSEEASAFHINVKQNGAELMAALDRASGKLNLTNTYWERSYLPFLADVFIKKQCRGPLYNLISSVCKLWYDQNISGRSLPEAWTDYTCGSYSVRIRDWIGDRRHGKSEPKTALAMNGIEFCQYTLPAVHDWAGIHLSGIKVNEEPIFIDPWYEQEWNENATGSRFGFKMQAAKLLATHTLLFSQFLVLVGIIYKIILALVVGEQFIVVPRLWQIKDILAYVWKDRVWPALGLLSTSGSYFGMGADTRHNIQYDDQYNYINYFEIKLFNEYLEDLKNRKPLPTINVIPWS